MGRSEYTDDNREIAHFFWCGDLNDMVINCIKSYVKNNFDVKLWSYEKHFIDGAESLDASLIIPKEKIIFNKNFILSFNYKNHSITGVEAFSDIFRLLLLSKYDGWWFDSDSFCLKDQSDFKKIKKDNTAIIPFVVYEKKMVPSNTNIYIPKEIAENVIEYLNYYIAHPESSTRGIDYIKYGSSFISFLIENADICYKKINPYVFSPIHWDNINEIYNPKFTDKLIELTKNSFSVHFYNRMPRKFNEFHSKNFINYLYQKLL